MTTTPPEPIELFQHTLPHGITLSCRAAGVPGRPVMVFVHGFPEAAFVWDPLLTHFSRPENGGYRCVAPNLRGFELSSAPTDVGSYRAKHLVQDLAALVSQEAHTSGSSIACLVAHDWGGAVAWGLAAQHPEGIERLCIINAPHPATFLRELQHSQEQQAASAYMNFLARPDAPALLAEHDFRRLWVFFEAMGATSGPHAWLTDSVREQYRAVWRQGLTGPCHYYGASPLRPATSTEALANAVQLPDAVCTVRLPTQVIWGMNDTALPAAMLDGLEKWVPNLQVDRVDEATHWLIHEQPERVCQLIQRYLLNSLKLNKDER